MSLSKYAIKPLDNQVSRKPSLIPRIPCILNIVSPIGCGKSTLEIRLITEDVFYKGKFHCIIIFSPTFYLDKKWTDVLNVKGVLKRYPRESSEETTIDLVAPRGKRKRFTGRIPEEDIYTKYFEEVLESLVGSQISYQQMYSDTARVLSIVPVIGAVSSQIGAAANIISSVSSAGVEIIDVGERYVSKHSAPEPTEPTELIVPSEQSETVSSAAPLFIAPLPGATMSPNVSLGFANTSQAPAIFNVLPPSKPVMAPTFAPIIPKNSVSYPGRHILPVRRPSAKQVYQKDEVEGLTERLSFLDIGSSVPKRLKTGGLFGASGASGTGRKQASLWA